MKLSPRLTIGAVRDGGFLVTEYDTSRAFDAPVFAGSLTEAMAYVEDRLDPPAAPPCDCGKGGK